MPNYHRVRISGGMVFFTLITFNRMPIFSSPVARELLRSAWMEVQDRHPFSMVAICLLPDHLHCIWSLPEGDANYSMRWKEIKRRFTSNYLLKIGPGGTRSASRIKRREVAIWQRRFWEHNIRDEVDLIKHIEYILNNPVKHGLAADPADWPWSSYHQYALTSFKMGNYLDVEFGE